MSLTEAGPARARDLASVKNVMKAVTPGLAGIVHATRLSAALELGGIYLSVLEGKGSGSGWDGGEAVAAARILRGRTTPVVFDCGANLGSWTEGVRARLGHGRGRWMLVEPVAEYAERLRGLGNVCVIEAAVGETAETLELHVPDRPSGWTSLHRRRDSFAAGVTFSTREVPVLRIDDIIGTHGIRQVDFLKLDLEGHELFALRGARASLERRKISALSFEFGSANVNSRTFFRDIWDLLAPLGYRIGRIVPGGRIRRVARYDETLEFFRGATNYVAVLPPGRGMF